MLARLWFVEASKALAAPATIRPKQEGALAPVPKWKYPGELEWILDRSQTACAHLHYPGNFEALSCKGTAEPGCTLDTVVAFWQI